MTDWLVQSVTDMPHWLATMLIAMVPVGELRLALPIALTQYDLSIPAAYAWAVIGNLIPVVLLLLWLDPVTRWLRRWQTFDRFFAWLFARTRRRFSDNFTRWGALSLILFVAIPLPMTGGWTGALAAYLFGIPFKVALPLVVIGVALAGIVVAAVTLGAIRFF